MREREPVPRSLPRVGSREPLPEAAYERVLDGGSRAAGRSRGPISGAVVVGSFSQPRARPRPGEVAVWRGGEGGVGVRPGVAPSPIRAASSATAARPSSVSGALTLSNATSPDNPLVTSAYQTMHRPGVARRR